MNFNKIDKLSFSYSFVRKYVKFAHDKIFYKKICITGLENIPKNKPLFFAPNHQNALMDALIVIFAVTKQVVFVARSDIFKNPIAAKILIWMKVLPAYRIRDGKENLKKNDKVFDASVKILENNNVITIFPEAQHTDKRRLRILKKAIQRIVFQTENANGFEMNIQIIPIGIYYKSYWNFRSTVQINFGKPISSIDFKEIYKENEQKAMLTLRDKMTESIKPLMIDIETEEFYDTYENLREIFNFEMRKKLNLTNEQKNVFIADKKIIEALNIELKNNYDNIKSIDKDVKEYTKGIKKYKIKDWILKKTTSFSQILLKSLILIFLSPIFIYGTLNNIIPYLLPSIITKKIKDKQFISSVVFAFGIITFPLFYIIQTIIFSFFIEQNWYAVLYMISLPITGLFAFSIHRYFVKTKSQFIFLLNKNKAAMKNLIEIRKKIISNVSKIVEKNLS